LRLSFSLSFCLRFLLSLLSPPPPPPPNGSFFFYLYLSRDHDSKPKPLQLTQFSSLASASVPSDGLLWGRKVDGLFDESLCVEPLRPTCRQRRGACARLFPPIRCKRHKTCSTYCRVLNPSPHSKCNPHTNLYASFIIYFPIKQAVADSRQEVAFQLGGWARGQQLTVKNSLLRNVTHGLGLGIGTNGGPLQHGNEPSDSAKAGNSWLTEWLLASREGLCSMELVIKLVKELTHCHVPSLESFVT
jgi:hypothetical protein